MALIGRPMAVIDTLKLARALRDKGGFTPEGAEATAEALAEALGSGVATKADVDRVETALKSDIRLLQWQIAVIYALQIAILVKPFVH